MRKLLSLVVLLIAAYVGRDHLDLRDEATSTAPSTGPSRDSSAVATAFDERRSGVQVEDEGVVVKVLPDDDDGNRHQRFILKLTSGQTVLIAHNIDLAPRVPELARDDRIAFFGEYEWNEQGGVVHWTHHDPGGRHVGGWLRREGRKFD